MIGWVIGVRPVSTELASNKRVVAAARSGPKGAIVGEVGEIQPAFRQPKEPALVPRAGRVVCQFHAFRGLVPIVAFLAQRVESPFVSRLPQLLKPEPQKRSRSNEKAMGI